MSEQTPQFDAALVRTWLDVLFIDTPGLIHVSSTGNWTGRTFTDHDRAAAYVAELDAKQPAGIYLRCTTLRGRPGEDRRGGDAEAAALPGLWADMDIDGPGHLHQVCGDDCPKSHRHITMPLPPDEEAVRKIITMSGLPAPTLWVHSGGGLYPWWLLDEPAEVGEDNLGEIQAMSARWQAVIVSAAKQLGWAYGAVGDLSRILRIPGTVNRKAEMPEPQPCRVIEAGAQRYTLVELRTALDAALAAMPEPEAPPQRRLTAVPRTDGGVSPGDDFEAQVDWSDSLLLGGLNWRFMYEHGGTSYWQRDGKTGRECSATTGRDGSRDRLWVFSTSTIFDTSVPYTKFGAYALIHHGGDHKAAAAALKSEGYGKASPLAPDPAAAQREAFAELLGAGASPPPPARTISAVDGTAARVLAEPAPEAAAFGATEDGMARALATLHGDQLRYCPQRGNWLSWSGTGWEWDDAEHHRELIKSMARTLPEDERDARIFKRRAMSAAGVSGIERQARSDATFVVYFDRLDADPWVLNTPTGIVDLRTGQTRPSDPDALCTRSTAVPLDPDADQGRWSEFLADTFGEDNELISYLQRLVGYSAIGMVGPHVLPFAFGSGGNGKGVFLEALTGVLGDYATTAPVGFLMTQTHQNHETEIARLAGARMVLCSEVNEDDRFDESRVKQLTGGDTITARFMRQDHFTFTPSHQLWLMGNTQPEVRTGGRSFWRRLRLLPFEHEVPEEKIVDDLQGILVRDHGPALLAWIVAGAVAYAQGGLREPERVKVATAEYAHDQDSVAKFVEERCLLGGGEHVRIKVATVREEYERWCYAGGEKAVSAKALTIALKRAGVTTPRDKSARMYGGLALLTDDENPSSRES